LKTKIRRLYDIANVLQSIGLIHKTALPQNNKPAFKWVGLHGVRSFLLELKALNIKPKHSGSGIDAAHDFSVSLPKLKHSQSMKIAAPSKLKAIDSNLTLCGSKRKTTDTQLDSILQPTNSKKHSTNTTTTATYSLETMLEEALRDRSEISTASSFIKPVKGSFSSLAGA
jgi:hypothetical protein